MKPNNNGRRLPEVLTDEERRQLLAQPNLKASTGLRHHCMIRLMLNLGLRASEMLSLESADIDWTSGRLHVKQGKGAKDRILWLNDEDLETLGRWKQTRAELVGHLSGPLFSTLRGERIDSRQLRAMVKRVARKAGIEKDVHPHLLRHTFATDLYRTTKNLRITQKALGHAHVSTTEIYTHIVDDGGRGSAEEFQGRLSPLQTFIRPRSTAGAIRLLTDVDGWKRSCAERSTISQIPHG